MLMFTSILKKMPLLKLHILFNEKKKIQLLSFPPRIFRLSFIFSIQNKLTHQKVLDNIEIQVWHLFAGQEAERWGSKSIQFLAPAQHRFSFFPNSHSCFCFFLHTQLLVFIQMNVERVLSISTHLKIFGEKCLRIYYFV